MSAEIITKDDLQLFRIQLLDDIKRLIAESQKDPVLPEWVKSGIVRKMLNVSPGTLQNLRINGQLHPKRISGTWYYNMSEIKALFNVDQK